jgi:uncharacterized protein YoaH (UPF0181 family)
MATDHYDPLKPPNPEEWLATDEAERTELVVDYHTREHIELPNANVHAMMHVIVENQIALGDEIPVARKLHQLMAQGLDRHEAIHAIASVLIQHLYGSMRGATEDEDPNLRYYAALRRLNARKWLRSG